MLAAYAYKGAQFHETARRTLKIAEPPLPGTMEFASLVEAMTQATLRDGNRVSVMRNGCEIFPALVDAIGAAKETISFSTYIWWGGKAAEEMTDALVSRAQEGLEIRILLDAWGSAKIDRNILSRLREAGVEVAWSRPLRWYELGKSNNRMHRRILVIDGRVAFTGGVGVAAAWEGNCERPRLWRETHVGIEGPAVRDILGGFVENWAEATGTVLSGRHLPEISPLEGGVPVVVTRSSATRASTAVEGLFIATILGATQRLWITTAYFAPAAGFVDALCDASTRGVDVRVLVNGRPIDKEVVRKAGQRSYGRLLEAGVRIFEYEKARLHAKVMVADDSWSNVGSANFDNRSFALEDEINVSVHDRTITSTLADHFLDDVQAAKEMNLQGWRDRPLHARLGEAASEWVRQSL